MARMSPEEKLARRINRKLEAFKCLRPHKCRNAVAGKLQLLRRMEESDSCGKCFCVTCGLRAHYKHLEGGHFISRSYHAVMLEETNIAPQCNSCNQHKHGNIAKYLPWMIETYGQEEVDRLESIKNGEGEKDRLVLATMYIELLDRISEEKKRIN